MFIEILKDSFKLFKKNLNLAQIMFLFFIVLSIFTPILLSVKINLRFIPMGIIFFILFCAFIAGLFFAFKKAIEYETTPPQQNNEFGLPPLFFAEFFQGIGLHLKKFVGAGFVVLALLFLTGFIYDYTISHFVVIPNELLTANYKELLMSDKAMMDFANSLSMTSQIKIAKISLFTFSLFAFFGLITMLYPVLLVEKESNFFKCFIDSLKFLFKNIILAIIIFLFFNICITFSAILSASTGNNFIVSIIAILLQCYLNVWYIFALFIYYEKSK